MGVTPFPSLADIFWISAYFPAIYILLTILKDKIKFIDLKGYILSAFFIALAVVLALIPALYHAQKDLTPIEAFVSTIYILLDIILIPILILLFILYLKKPMGILYGAFILSATFTLIGDILITTMRFGVYITQAPYRMCCTTWTIWFCCSRCTMSIAKTLK